METLKEDANIGTEEDQILPDLGQQKLSPFTFFPNPASDRLNIQIQQEGQHVISLVNIKGQEVYRSQNLDGAVRNEINLVDLESGIYLIQIFDSNGLGIHQEKVIVKK